MQIFIPYSSPIKVARSLDKRRLHKRVLESAQVCKAITGGSASWRNHPVVRMYGKHSYMWLRFYHATLYHYIKGELEEAQKLSDFADRIKPDFINDELCDQHKRRLYTKDPVFYSSFSKLGKSEDNWYIVNGEKLIYRNGKLINRENI